MLRNLPHNSYRNQLQWCCWGGLQSRSVIDNGTAQSAGSTDRAKPPPCHAGLLIAPVPTLCVDWKHVMISKQQSLDSWFAVG